MAEILRVSTEQMEKDFSSMKDQMDKVPAIFDEVKASMDRLSSCWDGAGWAAFQEQMSIDFEKLQELLDFYAAFAEAFQKSAEDYKNSEQKVYESIHSFRV